MTQIYHLDKKRDLMNTQISNFSPWRPSRFTNPKRWIPSGEESSATETCVVRKELSLGKKGNRKERQLQHTCTLKNRNKPTNKN